MMRLTDYSNVRPLNDADRMELADRIHKFRQAQALEQYRQRATTGQRIDCYDVPVVSTGQGDYRRDYTPTTDLRISTLVWAAFWTVMATTIFVLALYG